MDLVKDSLDAIKIKAKQLALSPLAAETAKKQAKEAASIKKMKKEVIQYIKEVEKCIEWVKEV
jgi:hypothetical protein